MAQERIQVVVITLEMVHKTIKIPVGKEVIPLALESTKEEFLVISQWSTLSKKWTGTLEPLDLNQLILQILMVYLIKIINQLQLISVNCLVLPCKIQL